jgi:hypothetical protein
MRVRVTAVVLFIGVLITGYVLTLSSQPSFNGTAPGCGPASGCHTFQSGLVSVTQLANLQLRITVSGTTSNVAGELVDSTGTVVAVNDGTSSNPFILTAPHAGRFTVNAGFRSPAPRRWDSTEVVIVLTDVREQALETHVTHFRLDQNYPNPFNPSTTIRYAIPASAYVSLEIFDNSGKKVSELVNGRQHFGVYTVTWDGHDQAAGVYFYRLVAGNYSETRKLLLLK